MSSLRVRVKVHGHMVQQLLGWLMVAQQQSNK